MITLLRSIRYPLFLRLLLIFGGTVFLFIIIAITATQFIVKGKIKEMGGYHYFEQHIQTVIDDIGTPPELEKASALAKQLPMTFLITGPELFWQSDTRSLNLKKIKVRHVLPKGAQVIRLARTRGFKVTRGDYQFYLFSKDHLLTSDDFYIIYLAIGAAVAAFFLNYWLVRRLLQPVRLLKEGAEKISHGELDYRVEHKRYDELGDLTISINSMADSLQDMLAAKQQLLLAISHELRTPITRAKVQLEFITDKKIKDSLQEDINEIDQLVSELLEAERLNSQHAALNHEDKLFGEFIQNTLTHYWSDQNSIQWQPPKTDHVVSIDSLRLSLLLRNLINNALRYAQNCPIIVSVNFTNDKAVLQIKDNGQGIAAEHLPHLTEPFYRADTARQRQTGGFGLGLYLCRLIAQAHGGSLSLHSKEGEGTCVLVSIPYLGNAA